MDSNNPNPTAQQMTPSAPATQPTPSILQQQPFAPNKENEPGSSNKMVLWLIIGLVVVILIVGGIYFYLSSQQQKAALQPQVTRQPTVEESLENELNAVEVSDLEAEFSSVDQDLQGL